jgi:hypothetical protein
MWREPMGRELLSGTSIEKTRLWFEYFVQDMLIRELSYNIEVNRTANQPEYV